MAYNLDKMLSQYNAAGKLIEILNMGANTKIILQKTSFMSRPKRWKFIAILFWFGREFSVFVGTFCLNFFPFMFIDLEKTHAITH